MAPIFRAMSGSCMHTTQVRGYNPMQLEYILQPRTIPGGAAKAPGLTELQGKSQRRNCGRAASVRQESPLPRLMLLSWD